MNLSERKTNDIEMLKEECMKNPEAKKFLDDGLFDIHYETIKEGNTTIYCKKESLNED